MQDGDKHSRSYFNSMKENISKSDECCERASSDVKEALKTITMGSSKLKEILQKLDEEEAETLKRGKYGS